MLWFIDRYVLGMAGTRIISGLIELSAAALMLKLNRVDQALRINAVLALVGPAVLLLVTTIGLAGLTGRISPLRMATIIAGVGLILFGVRHN